MLVKGSVDHAGHPRRTSAHEPKLQIVCLASGGGPSEDSVTGFLVRSVSKQWARNSVLAVDAGSHLAAITRLLEQHFPLVSATRIRNRAAHDCGLSAFSTDDAASEMSESAVSDPSETQDPTFLQEGPFIGLPFPYESARANALHVVRECVSTYLITHAHLDHLAAFAINTAAFHNTSRPKRLAALPSTVNAIKAHIFNDIIWPNLTDEDGGVGFVTFQRLTAGGNIAVGEGSGKGYIEVCDGLCVKALKISHGHCTRGPDAIPKRGSDVGLSEPTLLTVPASATASEGTNQRKPSTSQMLSPTAVQQEAYDNGCRDVVVDSTAYFIRDDTSEREILFFGDVEPDSLSLNPRTAQVWMEAAPKVAHGQLRAVLIECSYDDSQADNVLFGHLSPRHLFRELQNLADMVRTRKAEDTERRASRKRKRIRAGNIESDLSTAQATEDEGLNGDKRRSKKTAWHGTSQPNVKLNIPESNGLSPRTRPPANHEPVLDTTQDEAPLEGLRIIVIHVKDTLEDGPLVGDRILQQLEEHDARLKATDGVGLGCEFIISEKGGSYWV